MYHDDVMDEAPLRRGVMSANTRWTNSVAILTGDYLFAKVSDLKFSSEDKSTAYVNFILHQNASIE